MAIENTTKPTSGPSLKWDVAEHLDTAEAIAEYLTAAFEDGDPELIAAAIEDIIRAKNRDKWQPIATALLDENITIIGWRPRTEPATYQWSVISGGWAPIHDSELVCCWRSELKDTEILTHWMPLPEPPE